MDYLLDSCKLFYTLAVCIFVRRTVKLFLLTVHACSLARTGRRWDCAVFSSCEGDRGECQECSSVVIVLFTCQYAVYKYMTVCMYDQ